MFELNIPILSIILISLALIAAIVTIIFGLAPLRKTAKSVSQSPEISEEVSEQESEDVSEQESEDVSEQECSELLSEELQNEELPSEELRSKVSVVVSASADTEKVAAFLDMIQEQDYPNYEVIVVFDASPETAAMLTEELEGRYPEVHFTFIPTESHNLSRPKLAVTVGIKAATGEVVITTAANAQIPSKRWLSEMAAPFEDPNIEVVLGYSHGDYSELTGVSKWYWQFDFLLTSAQWLGAAASGKPYRGSRYNLAFRRDTFYQNKGYAHTMFLHHGEDDLFVNEITHRGNTALVLSKESTIIMKWGDSANRLWKLHKDSYQFTTRWLPKAPFTKAGLTSAAQWLIPALSVAGALVALPSLIPAIAALVILLTFWGFEIATYRKLAASLQAIRLWWAVVPFWLLRPISNYAFRMAHRRQRVKNYTWQR